MGHRGVYIYMTRVPEGKREEKGRKISLIKKWLKTFLNWKRKTDIKLQETQKILNKMN